MKAYAAAVLLAASAPPSFAAPSLRRHDPDDQEGPGARALQGEEVAPGDEAPDPDARALQTVDNYSWLLEWGTVSIEFSNMFAWGRTPRGLPCTVETSWGTVSTTISKHEYLSISQIAQMLEGGPALGTEFAGMFMAIPDDLSNYPFSNWDVSRGRSFNTMFWNTPLHVPVDFSNWDVSSGRSFASMFENTGVESNERFFRGGLSVLSDFSGWEIEVESDSGVSRMFRNSGLPYDFDQKSKCPRIKVNSQDSIYQPRYHFGPGPWDRIIRVCPGLCEGINRWRGPGGGRQMFIVHDDGDYNYYARCMSYPEIWVYIDMYWPY